MITHNLTVDVEPVMYDVDKLYLCPAERMPRELKGNMDLVISNMAFLYFVGPHLALENCLAALSIGGEARLSVNHASRRGNVVEFAGRLADTYNRLRGLRDDKRILLQLRENDIPILEYVPEDRNSRYFPFAHVTIIKLKE